jgi:predicted nucleic acid-binding protein
MLLDTSGLLCCLDASDFRHQDAVTFFEAANVRLTHNYILVEFVALAAARRLPRNIALLFAETLLPIQTST